MDFNKLSRQAIEDKDSFIRDFGYNLMTVSRKELPLLIDIAIQINDSYLYQKILNSLPFLLSKVKIGELGNLLEVLFRVPEYYNEICKNFDLLSNYFAPNNIETVIRAFLIVNHNSKLIADNLETILENAKTAVQSQRIMESVKHIPGCEEKINLYKSAVLNLGEYEFLSHLNPGSMLKLIENNKLDYIKDVFQKYSNGNLKKARFLANGFTSSAFLIDDKVIKIGKKRITFSVPFSKHLLQPYLREQLFDLENNVIATLEVQDECSTAGISEEEANEFIDKVKNSQVVWLDSSLENVFRLLKDNTRKVPPTEDGFIYDSDSDITPEGKPGDLIIGDTDFIFSKEDAKIREDSYKTPKHKTTFSLVLPTYNKQDYLGACLNSILNQTCDDYEVIIINDGSTDNSENIANQYSANDSRFKTFTFENGGLSTARNRGLNLATGDYIIFVDPDDSLEPELLEKLLPYVKDEIEVVRFGAVVQNETPKKDKFRFNRSFYPNITSGIDALRIWNNDKRYATVWLYCIKKDVYDRCRFEFPQVKIYEDLASMPNAIAHANSVAMLDYIGYNYIQHDDSITNTEKPNKPLLDLSGFITAYDFIRDSMEHYFENNVVENTPQVRNEILNGFFARLEDKFKHTNSSGKDGLAIELFTRNRIYPIDYKKEEYYAEASSGIEGHVFYTPEKNVYSLKNDDTTISKLGQYTFNINGKIDTIGLYRIKKSGNYNFTDSFLCLSDIDFEKAKNDETYKNVLFRYLLSYTNLFLAESLNGGYIGNIHSEEQNRYSILFSPESTKFANYWRSYVPKIENRNHNLER